MIREYRKLFKAIGHGKIFLLLLLLRAPFDMMSTLINALFLQHAFDAVGQGDTAALTRACLFFGVACICLFLYNGMVWGVYAPFAARMEGRLRRKLYGTIASLPYERIERTSHGDWLTRLNTDVEMPFSLAVPLPHMVCSIVNIVVSALILWRINPAVFGWVLLFVAPHIAVNQFFFARKMPGLNHASLEATAKTTGVLTAFITCADTAALYDAQGFLMGQFEKSSLALRSANMRIHAKNALSAGILPLFGLGGYLALLIACSGWIARGQLTFGSLTAAFQYRGGVLVGAILLIHCLMSIQGSMAGIRRLNETMAEKTEGTTHG